MNNKNLMWIIPLVLIVGFVSGMYVSALGQATMMENYPVIRCIYNMDNAMNVDGNTAPFTEESQRAVIQKRCAQEFVNMSPVNYSEDFEFEPNR